MSGTQGNLGAIPAGHQRERVRCMNGCTGPRSSSILTWPKGESKPRHLCDSCKDGKWEGKMRLSREHAPKALDPTEWHGSPVHIFRRGDPGFAERAAECTPIHLVANVSKASEYVFCFDLEAKQRIIRREKREASAN